MTYSQWQQMEQMMQMYVNMTHDSFVWFNTMVQGYSSDRWS